MCGARVDAERGAVDGQRARARLVVPRRPAPRADLLRGLHDRDVNAGLAHICGESL